MARTRALLAAPGKAGDGGFFRALCLDVAGDLDVDQVSVWTFDADLTRIDCQCSYDALGEVFSEGQTLEQSTCPRYFKKIVEDNFVSADDVEQHAATKEFLETYFRPHGIRSLLDFILHDDMQPYGIICCENRRDLRAWQESDRDYLRSIAALTSFLFLPAHRRLSA